jgi:alpha-2-macroglobulin
MLAFLRAGLVAALTILAPFSALAADKPFKNDELADAAVKLEAQIKEDAGSVAKPVATLRREADAAYARNDLRGGMQILAQIVAVAPQEAANWIRLSRAILQIRPANDDERRNFLERAATAAYIAYQRSGNRNEEADALVLMGRSFADRQQWRPALDAYRLSLELREVADIRGTYERLRADYGFRVLDYTVDNDAASPRACFQFSEALPAKRVDFSPFVVVGGQDKPALSVDSKQLCVEGLKHGERYSVTLRAGLPSVVQESLTKSADFSVYVRDRSPFVRFTGKAYVLPRTGQRGIPVVTVNTDAAKIDIYRVGDRNLISTVTGEDFQRNLSRYDLEQLGNERGTKVWSGELKVEQRLNTDVVTAFPVGEAVGDLQPGVYVMSASAKQGASDDYGPFATQWFIVSDLGLTAFSGSDGVGAFVHSLASAEPKAGVEVRLVARNNEVLGVKTTDAQGFVRFEPGLARGEGGLAPALLVAAAVGDYAFLSLKGPAFDLSDRGVTGRPSPAGLDAFVYTERGVYRSGENVYITALLRDAQGVAALGVPLTLVVDRPDGVEYRRTVLPDQGLGGRSLTLPMVSTAPTGTYRVKAFTDPKRPAVGETTFLVEDYVPDRLEFELASPTGRIAKNTPAEVTVDGRYLYGAPASALTLEGEVTITQASERPGFAGYQFGLNDEENVNVRQPLEDLPETDAQGKASFTVSLDKVPSSTRPLQAQVVVRMAEAGGRAVERKLTLPVTPAADMIGVKPLFSGRSLGEGEMANFDVVMVSPDGKPLARAGLRWELLKVESKYQYYRQDGTWHYEPVKSTRRIADGKIDVTTGTPARISTPVSWGRYRLEVATDDPNGAATSVNFDAGFYTEASADTPDMLEIALDKKEYRAGDTINVAVTARAAGKLTINVVGDRLIASSTVDVSAGTAQIPVKVGADWGTGAYVVATLRRPLDAQAQRMPGRAIGVQWFSVDRAARTLAVDMKLPDLMRPNGTLRIPVKLNGLAAGEEARIVVAAVDVGILNLTNYKPPAPDEYYLGQRRLSAEIRDLYGQLIDGMQGTVGQIRTGGDGAGMGIQGSPPTQPPLALYSGIVTVGPDGTAEVAFDIPAFAGSVRVMAIAWSKDKVGRASGDVIVRDPVVLTTTLPRFLLVGDRGGMRLEVDNVEGAAGEYRLAVTSDGTFAVGDGGSATLRLDAKQRSGLSLPLSATRVGVGTVNVRVTGPGGFDLARSYTLAAKPATQVLARRTVRSIARDESLTVSNDLLADLVPGSGAVAISVGPSTALDVAYLLKSLDRYPFGCSEQITSRAMPLLYVNELASEAHLALDTAIDQRIKDSIDRVLARQGSNGSFGLWAPGGEDGWLDAYVTDFLTRARERGFAVPDTAFKLALDRLRNSVSTAAEPSKDGGRNLAYALYVLARNGVAPVGDLRYLADAKLNDLATPIAKAQIAAALGMLGDRARAERVFAAAVQSVPTRPVLEYGRVDYGSALRDSAALVTLASESGAPRPTVLDAVHRVEAAHEITPYLSTQEQAWLVLAARALSKEGVRVSLDVEGQAQQGPFYRTYRPAELANPVRVVNKGDGTVQAVVTVTGAPVTPEPAAEKGFKIERNYFTLGGEPANPANAKQNQRFVVVLRITDAAPKFARVIVADYLPAGFEIDNPKLVSSGDTGALSWISDAAEPVSSEFRDDRFAAAFERKSGDPAVFAVAYVVRAVSPGRYVLPQAYVEDMYRPERFGRTGTGTVEIEAGK